MKKNCEVIGIDVGYNMVAVKDENKVSDKDLRFLF